MYRFASFLFAFCFALLVNGMHTPDEWSKRTIYQIMTDRFSRNATDTSPCNLSKYCGGTFRGIADHLDYIKGLGMFVIIDYGI